MKNIYKFSKTIHKWSSIIISIFIIWMSISGILLNHPDLISSFSVSKSFIPSNYYFDNWNRSSINDYKFFKTNKKIQVIGGNEGIFISLDGGKNFSRLYTKGLPNSQYYNKTKSIYLIEDSVPRGILAGTFGGLYYYDFNKKIWENIKLNNKNEKIVKIIDYKNSIAVFSSSGMYLLNNQINQTPKQVELLRDEKETKLTLIELFFQLHTGEIWGLPGKIIFDLASIGLLFLSVSGIIIWLTPKTSKLKIGINNKLKEIKWLSYKFLYKYHLKIGIYSVVVLLIIGITGFFMRPPGIAMILSGDIEANKIPFLKITNYWQDRIRNAMYDKENDKLIIDAKDGFWVSDSSNNFLFKKTSPPVPIFAMGATVLEKDSNGDYLIGSFTGLFRLNFVNNYKVDALTGDTQLNVSVIKPGSNLITSYFKTPNGEEFITTHFDGLRSIQRNYNYGDIFNYPKELSDNFRMPLWNYLFELHNGRIFQFLIGEYYILIIPLGAIIFVISLLTGLFDWLYLKLNHKKEFINNNKKSEKQKNIEKSKELIEI